MGEAPPGRKSPYALAEKLGEAGEDAAYERADSRQCDHRRNTWAEARLMVIETVESHKSLQVTGACHLEAFMRIRRLPYRNPT